MLFARLLRITNNCYEEVKVEKLAIDGGRPVRKKPFPPRLLIGKEEKRAILKMVNRTLLHGGAFERYGGTEVDTYEKEFAKYYGTKFATAMSSGTSAIHSALGALKLEPGTEVITSPITDPGAIAPILFQLCIPVFTDVEYETLNISPRAIEKNITKKTKVIIVTHLAGQPAKMDEIMKIARKNKLIVIEDCAQSHGAKYKGKYAGAIGDMGCFSLMSGKHTTSGGQGGMVTTNSEKLYWNVKRFADRGKPFNSREKTNLFLGLNYRMTELEAVIGRVQLKKLKKIAQKRKWIYDSLNEKMKKLYAFRLWKIVPGAEVNPWFCFVHYTKDVLKRDKDEVVKALAKEGLPIGAKYMNPLYEWKWIKERNTFGNSHYPYNLPGVRKIDYTDCCPDAKRSLNDHMTLFIHEGWTKKEIEDTAKAFEKVEKYWRTK